MKTMAFGKVILPNFTDPARRKLDEYPNFILIPQTNHQPIISLAKL